jgi:glycolate oxidase FAD binding subunit
VGRASHIVVGNPLSRVDLAISMARLNGILSYEPADMTVTAEAGVTLADLERTLSEHGQWLPLDPPPGDESTLGGLLAANVFGPLRHRYGTARDWLLGLRAVLADGTTIKSGGRVVKNVSGYDLHKVFVGSLGTLGAIAEVTLKVAPLPRVDRTFTITCGSAAEAAGVIMSAHEATLSLAAAELLSPTAASALTDTGAWTALVRVAGGSAATGRTADDLHQLASLAHGSLDEVDVEVWPRWRARFAPGALGLRMSVMPSRAGEVAESLDRALAGAAPHVSSTVSAGLIRLNLTPRDEQSSAHLVERARQIAEQRGGFTVIDSAPLAYKRTVDVFGAARADIEIMRRLKQEFDPKGILSPGRFVGRI